MMEQMFGSLMQQLFQEINSMKRMQFWACLFLIFLPRVSSFDFPRSFHGNDRRDISSHQRTEARPRPVTGAASWSQSSSCASLHSTVDNHAADGGAPGLHASSPSYIKLNRVSRGFADMRVDVVARLRKNDFRGAFQGINEMFDSLQATKLREDVVDGGTEASLLCEEIDKAMLSFYKHAFATPFRGRKAVQRVSIGMEALHLQLSSQLLDTPYNSIPKRYLLDSLNALTRASETSLSHPSKSSSNELSMADEAYRVLQRLVTGVGIRNLNLKKNLRIHESDFNAVLNAYVNAGRMDMAHRVVALQERTPHAPPVSPVAYSILLKGYGRLHDSDNIEKLLNHASSYGVEPDVIMLNSLIDAYINCGDIDKAKDIFESMKRQSSTESELVTTAYSRHTFLFAGSAPLLPNRRTYNTILKGLSKAGALEEALELSNEMEKLLMWDAVTTNTLVQAAVNFRDFDQAERILNERTETIEEQKPGRNHRNVEAYTTLLDGFAKAGRLTKALETLRVMGDRGVEPNEVTYSCMVGGLARHKKHDEARKMIAFMQSKGVRPSVVTYNSMISGLVGGRALATNGNQTTAEHYDDYVNEAIHVLRKMMSTGVHPNSVTVSVLIDAFGKCERPRVEEAKALIAKLVADGVIAANNTIISTALVQVCGVGKDFEGAKETFRGILNPDTAAVNSFLDACCRCEKDDVLAQSFKHYFQGGATQNVQPDVISYSIFITALLRKNLPKSTWRAFELYQQMKDRRGLSPDKAMVDM